MLSAIMRNDDTRELEKGLTVTPPWPSFEMI